MDAFNGPEDAADNYYDQETDDDDADSSALPTRSRLTTIRVLPDSEGSKAMASAFHQCDCTIRTHFERGHCGCLCSKCMGFASLHCPCKGLQLSLMPLTCPCRCTECKGLHKTSEDDDAAPEWPYPEFTPWQDDTAELND
eukprot:3179-Heterococcus_DN1.PRE.1